MDFWVSVPDGSFPVQEAILIDSTPGLDESDYRVNCFFALNINIKNHIKYNNHVDVPLLIIMEIHCLSIDTKIFANNVLV